MTSSMTGSFLSRRRNVLYCSRPKKCLHLTDAATAVPLRVVRTTPGRRTKCFEIRVREHSLLAGGTVQEREWLVSLYRIRCKAYLIGYRSRAEAVSLKYSKKVARRE